jgi:hypothetical protein
VLVHGAFADASSWNGVIERLQREGYAVVADSAYLTRLMNQIARYFGAELSEGALVPGGDAILAQTRYRDWPGRTEVGP